MKQAVVAILVMSSVFVGCGGRSQSPTQPSTPTPSPSPTPTTRTWSLSGRVTETPPTQTLPVAVATVRIADGPNAGRSTTTDINGNYRLADLQQSGFTVTASANGYESVSLGVDLTSDKTLNFQLPPIGPRRRFGPGTYRVGPEIAPGRYFVDPSSSCYWERLRGFGGTLGDIIANEFIGYDAGQEIVDILASDAGFKTDAPCGVWTTQPPRGAQATISPGKWLVGSQVSPGTYRADARAGCYWERLRNFEGVLASIIANDFVSAGGSQLVEIRASDVGFNTDDDCGTWTRATLTLRPGLGGEISPAQIQRNWHRERATRMR